MATSKREIDKVSYNDPKKGVKVVAGDEEAGRLTSRGHLSLYDIFCNFLDKQIEL